MPDGSTAQNTEANRAQLGKKAKVVFNGSDNLVLILVAKAMNCQPWSVPNIIDPGHVVASLALNEMQAKVWQAEPVALVPVGNPMVLFLNLPSIRKTNLYRRGVDQPDITSLGEASTREYCMDYLQIAPPRMKANRNLLKQFQSPDPATGNNLFTFLANRFTASFGDEGLQCNKRLGVASPVIIKTNTLNVAIEAEIENTTMTVKIMETLPPDELELVNADDMYDDEVSAGHIEGSITIFVLLLISAVFISTSML